MPKSAKPQIPEVSIGETVGTRPILNNIGAELMPAQEAANIPAELKYEAAAIEPPYTPHPAF